MSKCDIWPFFECQNVIFGPCLNVKKAFRMSKCDIRPELNDRIGIRMSNAIFVLNSNVKTGCLTRFSTIITLETLTCFEVQKR